MITGLAFYDPATKQLRCAAPRDRKVGSVAYDTRSCNQLLAIANRNGELKGLFRCLKCDERVEVS